ncbi:MULTISPECIES: hypothetical protein [unclassified Nocardioides]|uniref:hypothetical protein n=1 Tax=unclassified Nocardioides TaxID=2615069 RepID=UPI000A59DA07|nr:MULTISPECIES: hypothetical protein [unclassified Nocardioides]
MRLPNWAWRMTAQGMASTAYERGDRTYSVTLDVLTPGHTRALAAIASAGWRLDDKIEYPRVKNTKVTPKPDGTHDVVRTVSQNATFYFVRNDNQSTSSIAQVAPPATWPANWYQTAHGWRWWDGTQWAHPYVSQPQLPYQQAPYGYRTAMAGMSNGEHVLHLVLTFFSCGLWAPVWIVLAIKKGKVQPR